MGEAGCRSLESPNQNKAFLPRGGLGRCAGTSSSLTRLVLGMSVSERCEVKGGIYA